MTEDDPYPTGVTAKPTDEGNVSLMVPSSDRYAERRGIVLNRDEALSTAEDLIDAVDETIPDNVDAMAELAEKLQDDGAEDGEDEAVSRGVYLLADTPTSATPLATESGDGDHELLHEALVDHKVPVDVDEIRTSTVLDAEGEAVVAIKGKNGVMVRVGVPKDMVGPFVHTVEECRYVYDDEPHEPPHDLVE